MSKYVVHCKREPYDIYIGRPSKWGNPFIIGKDGTRETVIAQYANWIWFHNFPLFKQIKKELRGKVLGCWCKPNCCHGDFLAAVANDLPWVWNVQLDE